MAFEDWDIHEQIGQGGQGTVSRVENKLTGQVGVMKQLIGWRHKDKQSRERMPLEVEALKKMNSEKSFPVLFDENMENSQDKEAKLYFVMEQIDGKTLHDEVMERGGLSVEDAVEKTRTLMHSFHKMHNKKLVHRDIKPQNIMVRNWFGNDFVIVDFGIAHDNEGDFTLTQSNEIFRNEFMTLPEHTNLDTKNKRRIQSDITNVVGLLFFFLTGVSPGLLMDENLSPPHRRADDLKLSPRALSIFDKGFQYDMAARYQSFEDLLSDMDSLINAAYSIDEVGRLFESTNTRLEEGSRAVQINKMKTFCSKNVMSKLDLMVKKYKEVAGQNKFILKGFGGGSGMDLSILEGEKFPNDEALGLMIERGDKLSPEMTLGLVPMVSGMEIVFYSFIKVAKKPNRNRHEVVRDLSREFSLYMVASDDEIIAALDKAFPPLIAEALQYVERSMTN